VPAVKVGWGCWPSVSYFLAEARYGDPYLFFRKHIIAVTTIKIFV